VVPVEKHAKVEPTKQKHNILYIPHFLVKFIPSEFWQGHYSAVSLTSIVKGYDFKSPSISEFAATFSFGDKSSLFRNRTF
jgi:hypothetical protein